MTIFSPGCPSESVETSSRCLGRTATRSNVTPSVSSTASPSATSGRSSQSGSGMLWMRLRTPTTFGLRLSSARRSAAAADRLAELRRNPKVVGVRNLIHNIPDPDWLLRPDVDEGLAVLETEGVTFDLVAVLPRHLELVSTLSERHPGLKIVIDHLAKPPIGLDGTEPWWTLIERAAENPLVHAKVSGLYSATADSSAWTTDAVRPFVMRALEVFGADRLMYGGDWPISLLSGGYRRVWEGLSVIFAELGSEEQRWVLGGTAERFYGIDATALGVARGASRSHVDSGE